MVSMSKMESFQFKGECRQWQSLTATELEVFEQYMRDFDLAASNFGIAPGAVYNYPHREMISLIMEVKEVFEQTPREGTGRKIL
jgi:hypothetical protein